MFMISVLILKRSGTKAKKKQILIDKNEAREVIKRIERILQEREENYIDAREALELLVPDLKMLICYVERIQISKKEEL